MLTYVTFRLKNGDTLTVYKLMIYNVENLVEKFFTIQK